MQRRTGSITFSKCRIIMARTRLKSKGRRENGTYVGIPHAITRSREYAALSAIAVKLLIDLADQFNGSNNGDFQATWPFMKSKGWRSKATLYRALNELLNREFVIVSRQGGRHVCSLYALTFLAIDDCKGKLDINETTVPSSAWKKNSVPQKLGHIGLKTGPIHAAK